MSRTRKPAAGDKPTFTKARVEAATPEQASDSDRTPVTESLAASISGTIGGSPNTPSPYQPAASADPAEAEAVARTQAGDPNAFAQLYFLHKKRIYSLCMRMVGNLAEAEDLTQEAFLQLHRKISSFRGDSAFSTWLHRLTVNVVLMHLRKKGLALVSLDELLSPAQDHGAVQGPSRGYGAADPSLTGAIDRMALERAVGSLPAGYRLIFVLHDMEGFEHNEIAAMLDCSIGNSKSQLHKARLRLRDALRASPTREVEQ
jgi:RNA polymerase sigma-70 factor (ECF subfamily)